MADEIQLLFGAYSPFYFCRKQSVYITVTSSAAVHHGEESRRLLNKNCAVL